MFRKLGFLNYLLSLLPALILNFELFYFLFSLWLTWACYLCYFFLGFQNKFLSVNKIQILSLPIALLYLLFLGFLKIKKTLVLVRYRGRQYCILQTSIFTCCVPWHACCWELILIDYLHMGYMQGAMEGSCQSTKQRSQVWEQDHFWVRTN